MTAGAPTDDPVEDAPADTTPRPRPSPQESPRALFRSGEAAEGARLHRPKATERFDVRHAPPKGGPETQYTMPAARLPAGQNLRRVRKLLVGLVFLAIYVAIPTPHDLSTDGKNAIGLFLFIVYLWITEALPLPVTALLAGVGFLALGIKDDPNAAFEPYAQDTFFFILGSLILADGITKSGADGVLAHRMLRLFGHDTHTLLFGIIASCAMLAAFLSDHVVAAIMLPVVVGILRNTGLRAQPRFTAAYLIAIAFGTNIAGLATPSGGSRNAVALGYLRDIYGVEVSYLDWLVRAAPITIALIPVVYVVIALVFRVPFRRLEPKTIDPGAHRFTGPQWAAVGILAATVVMWVGWSDDYGLGGIAVLGAVLMFVFGILDWEDTRSTIPWGVAFVYGAALAMGRVLKETLAADWLARHAFWLMPQGDVMLLVVFVIVITVVMTNFLSDGATVAVIAPVTLALALVAGYDLASMGILTAVSSAFAFILVIGTPPNLIVYASGGVRPMDFIKAGVPMTIAAFVILLFAVQWLWPRIGNGS